MWDRSGVGPIGPIKPLGPGSPGGPISPVGPGEPFGPGSPETIQTFINELKTTDNKKVKHMVFVVFVLLAGYSFPNSVKHLNIYWSDGSIPIKLNTDFLAPR